ncbi:MAG: ubiquinone anaerobic biosynthesis accessory factor UbiT [Gammaproteobacteria bacterium]
MLSLSTIEQVLPVLARPLRRVPHPLQRAPLQLALETIFQASVAAGELEFLDQRCLAIEIEDTGWRWPVTLAHGRLRVLERDHPADVTIRGQSPAFLIMASRLEDPDTLFFQRRLVIEGDTELGLGVKNFLDGLDEERLPLPLRIALRGAREAHGRFAWRT